mmetsp:Transcript_5889/g.13971  ORF Transcript_5889/g.13971 Transcript_5889/m.13971 type:complete len:465 (-) Transcript_5889:88-1482(-)
MCLSLNWFRFFLSNLDGSRVQLGAGLGGLLVPERRWQDLLGVASALELLDNRSDFGEKTFGGVEGNGVKSQVAELGVGNIQFVLGSLLTRVGDEVGFNSSQLGNHLGDIPDATGLGDLVEDLDTFSLVRGVVDGDLNAPGSISDVDEGTSLTSGSVNSQWNTHSSLHEETVQDSSVISVVVESVDKTFVQDGLRSVGSPDDTLVQIGDSELIVLLVELPQDSIKTLGCVVDRSRVGRVQNVGFASSWKGDINVSFWDFTSRSSVSVDTHGSQVNNVGIQVGINNGTAQVVGSRNVVVDGVSLSLGVLHGVRGSTLFSKVNNGIWLFFLDKLDQQVVILGNIHVDELHFLAADFLPCVNTGLHAANGSQRIASKIKIDLSSGKVVDNYNIVSLVTQVQRCWPSAETITSQNNNLLLFSSAGAVSFSIQCEQIETGSLLSKRGSECSHRGQDGDDKADHSHVDGIR